MPINKYALDDDVAWDTVLLKIPNCYKPKYPEGFLIYVTISPYSYVFKEGESASYKEGFRHELGVRQGVRYTGVYNHELLDKYEGLPYIVRLFECADVEAIRCTISEYECLVECTYTREDYERVMSKVKNERL